MAHLQSKFSELGDMLPKRGADLVEKIAHDVEAEAKMRSRVDTGAMRNAWHVREPVEEDNLFAREVVNNVEYSVYNELGTVKKPAQPMLTPAMERQKAAFKKGISKLLESP